MNRLIKNFLIIHTFLFSCTVNVQEPQPDMTIERMKKKEALISLNKYIVNRNQDLIRSFIRRSGWNMKSTGSGLWYEIIKPGNGQPAKPETRVGYTYKLLLLDGTFCDSVSQNNLKMIRMGKGGVESGLEEALLLLREGDQARFIIPPHLAHGYLGDGSKIPPGAILIYDVCLLKVQDE